MDVNMELITTCEGCGGEHGHWASCPIRFGKPLPPASVIRAELVGKIANACAQIDKVHGNPPGTCERAVYWAYWPPSASTSIEVLCALLNDARVYLRTGKFPLPPLPEMACEHSPKASRRNTKPGRQRRIPDPA